MSKIVINRTDWANCHAFAARNPREDYGESKELIRELAELGGFNIHKGGYVSVQKTTDLDPILGDKCKELAIKDRQEKLESLAAAAKEDGTLHNELEMYREKWLVNGKILAPEYVFNVAHRRWRVFVKAALYAQKEGLEFSWDIPIEVNPKPLESHLELLNIQVQENSKGATAKEFNEIENLNIASKYVDKGYSEAQLGQATGMKRGMLQKVFAILVCTNKFFGVELVRRIKEAAQYWKTPVNGKFPVVGFPYVRGGKVDFGPLSKDILGAFYRKGRDKNDPGIKAPVSPKTNIPYTIDLDGLELYLKETVEGAKPASGMSLKEQKSLAVSTPSIFGQEYVSAVAADDVHMIENICIVHADWSNKLLIVARKSEERLKRVQAFADKEYTLLQAEESKTEKVDQPTGSVADEPVESEPETETVPAGKKSSKKRS